MLACGSYPPGEALGEHRASIVGGEPSTEDQDATVLMVRGGFISWCTAFVVSPNLLMTARHCLYTALLGEDRTTLCGTQYRDTPVVSAWDPESFSVFVGKERPLKDAVAHGTHVYSGSDLDLCKNDVALLEVDPPLAVKPLALRLDGPPALGEACTLVGWGVTAENERLADQRQQREVVVEALGPSNYAPPGGPARALEASTFAGTEAGCPGDSGGPLISQQTGAVIGVQAAVSNLDPVVGLDEEQVVSQCFGSVSLFQRLDLQESWIRRAFRAALTAPWLESHPAPAALGQTCGSADDCLSGLCVSAGASNFCSMHCDAAPCPDDMSCVGPSEDRICVLAPLVASEPVPPAGCTLPGAQRERAHVWFATLFLLVLSARRQGQRSRRR
jgi:hypothetical protein